MPSTDYFGGKSIPPEKLTRNPAPSGKVKTLVNRVTEVQAQVDAGKSQALQPIRSNPDLLRNRRAASAAAHSTINAVSYELQSDIDLINGATNNIPFNIPTIGGKGGQRGDYTAGTNFIFRAPCERLGIYQVYFYVALELPAPLPNLQQLIPMLYKNGTFHRAGDWATMNNSSYDGVSMLGAALQMTTLVELSALEDYIEPILYFTGSGNATCFWNPNPLASSVYGYIDITYIGCNENVRHLLAQSDSHPRI